MRSKTVLIFKGYIEKHTIVVESRNTELHTHTHTKHTVA